MDLFLHDRMNTFHQESNPANFFFLVLTPLILKGDLHACIGKDVAQ